MIVAIVRPHVVPRLMDVLRGHSEIRFGSIKEVKGFGRQKNYLNEYLGSEYSEVYIPKVFFEIRVDAAHLEQVLTMIVETSRTGRMGDGKIFVCDGSYVPLEDANIEEFKVKN